MTRSMRAALIAFAVALALLPVLSLHPLLLHLDEQGEMEWRRGLTDPGFLTLLAIAAIAALFVLPLCSLMVSARRSRRVTRELAETAQRRTAHGIEYFWVAAPDFFIANVGLWRPAIFVSSAAEARLGPAGLHAALLHEEAHRRRKDTLWRWALMSLTQPMQWLPGVGGLRRETVLRSECQADDDALTAGATRHALFEAMVVAADGAAVPTGARLADGAVEYRLLRVAAREHALPRDSAATLAGLTAILASLPVLAHLLIAAGLVCVG